MGFSLVSFLMQQSQQDWGKHFWRGKTTYTLHPKSFGFWPYIHTFIHSNIIHSFKHSYIHLYIHSFIHIYSLLSLIHTHQFTRCIVSSLRCLMGPGRAPQPVTWTSHMWWPESHLPSMLPLPLALRACNNSNNNCMLHCKERKKERKKDRNFPVHKYIHTYIPPTNMQVAMGYEYIYIYMNILSLSHNSPSSLRGANNRWWCVASDGLITVYFLTKKWEKWTFVHTPIRQLTLRCLTGEKSLRVERMKWTVISREARVRARLRKLGWHFKSHSVRKFVLVVIKQN